MNVDVGHNKERALHDKFTKPMIIHNENISLEGVAQLFPTPLFAYMNVHFFSKTRFNLLLLFPNVLTMCLDLSDLDKE